MPRMLAALAPLIVAGAITSAAAGTAHVDYMLQCQGCHLADGSGAPGSVPALNEFVGNYLLVPGGREYLIRVPGSALSPLSDARLAGVLNWIIRVFGPERVAAAFVPFSAEEVARHRNVPLTEVEPLRSELRREIERAMARGSRR